MTTSNNNDPNAVVAADAAASLTLTTSMLHAADGSRSVPTSDIVYTVAISPLKGTLTVNGTTLGLNGQFTQDQIDHGLVVYTNTKSSTDLFDFSISDPPFGDALGTPLDRLASQFPYVRRWPVIQRRN